MASQVVPSYWIGSGYQIHMAAGLSITINNFAVALHPTADWFDPHTSSLFSSRLSFDQFTYILNCLQIINEYPFLNFVEVRNKIFLLSWNLSYRHTYNVTSSPRISFGFLLSIWGISSNVQYAVSRSLIKKLNTQQLIEISFDRNKNSGFLSKVLFIIFVEEFTDLCDVLVTLLLNSLSNYFVCKKQRKSCKIDFTYVFFPLLIWRTPYLQNTGYRVVWLLKVSMCGYKPQSLHFSVQAQQTLKTFV